MKKRISLPLRLLFYAILLSVASCQKSSILDPVESSIQSHLVSTDDAKIIALIQPTRQKNKLATPKEIQDISIKYDETNNPLLYIITYKSGGFIIISADDRFVPVLAYSDTNLFPMDWSKMPSGLLDWFSGIQKSIGAIRNANPDADKLVKLMWDRLIVRSSSNARWSTVEGDCNTDPSMTIFTQIDHLTQTTWDQGDGYNDWLAYASCTTTSNGKYVTGCTATALAQIMKFHGAPSAYYNFSNSNMPLNSGSSAIAVLMHDLDLPYNLNPIFGCSGTSAPTTAMTTTLGNFGYSSSLASYNYFTVKSEIQSNRPVILTGTDTGKSEAHAWVCDGFQHWDFYNCVPDPNTPGEKMAAYNGYTANLSMNWGWGGWYNGFYYAYSFNVAGYSFNSYNQMITIHP